MAVSEAKWQTAVRLFTVLKRLLEMDESSELGPLCGSRQRSLRTPGACDHRWITCVGVFDGIYRSLGGAAGLPESQRCGRITGPPARTDTNALTSKADFLV